MIIRNNMCWVSACLFISFICYKNQNELRMCTTRNKEYSDQQEAHSLNGHLSIRYFTLNSCKKGSYLLSNSPIIE